MPTRAHPEHGDQNGALAVFGAQPDETPQFAAHETKPPAALTEEELRAAEPDLIEYLFKSADRSATRVAVLELPRFEVPLKDADGAWQRDEHGRLILGPLTLRVHALYQRDVDDVRRRTRPVRRRDERGRMVEVPDPVELACRTIEAALVDEDRALLNDKRMRDKFQAGDVPGVIARMLNAGEALRAADLVRRISDIPLDISELDQELLENASGEAQEH